MNYLQNDHIIQYTLLLKLVILFLQDVARNLGIDEVYDMNLFAINDVMPDKTLFFDIDYKKGLERIKVNQRETNRLDLEKSDFHKNVYEGYLTICKQYSDRIVKINADQKVEDVVQDALKEIKKIL